MTECANCRPYPEIISLADIAVQKKLDEGSSEVSAYEAGSLPVILPGRSFCHDNGGSDDDGPESLTIMSSDNKTERGFLGN